ncbi:hypothetical protein K0M31_013771 [Melipona bicolor]|uniref:Uncharacterized protein n=1 Tax=Melipona bicolor TaxID=60889 RepID=A0AA40FHJ5_9HYME|nr:hypothetical protein K0M31_013771 [Melipona bicolor]
MESVDKLAEIRGHRLRANDNPRTFFSGPCVTLATLGKSVPSGPWKINAPSFESELASRHTKEAGGKQRTLDEKGKCTEGVRIESANRWV